MVEDFSNFINTNRRDNWRIVRCRRCQHTSNTIVKGRNDLQQRNGPHPSCGVHEIVCIDEIMCLVFCGSVDENSGKNYGLDLFARTKVERRIEESVDDNENVIQRYAENGTAGDLWMDEWSRSASALCVRVSSPLSRTICLRRSNFFCDNKKKTFLTWSVCMALV